MWLRKELWRFAILFIWSAPATVIDDVCSYLKIEKWLFRFLIENDSSVEIDSFNSFNTFEKEISLKSIPVVCNPLIKKHHSNTLFPFYLPTFFRFFCLEAIVQKKNMKKEKICLDQPIPRRKQLIDYELRAPKVIGY